MTSPSIFLNVVLFLLSSLNTGPSFVSISSQVLELWQFCLIRDWPKTWKLEIPQSEFCPISGEWGKLGIPNLARISLIKCYWMLTNTKVTPSTVSKLLRGNQQGRIRPPHTQIRVKIVNVSSDLKKIFLRIPRLYKNNVYYLYYL